MPMMLGPTDFGLSSIMPPPHSPLGQTLVKALMGKHGVAVPSGAPTPTNAAPSTAPVDPASVPVGVKAGEDVAALPTVNIPGADTPLPTGAPVDLSSALNTQAKAPGFLDRIGDFIHSDEGRAALLRSGAETLQHGIGAGIMAGADFMDKRNEQRGADAQQAFENAFKTSELNQHERDSVRRWELGEDQNNTTGAHYERQDANEGDRNSIDVYKWKTPSGGEKLQSATTQYTHATPSGDALVSAGTQKYTHDTPSGDAQLTQQGETFRQQHPVATPAPVKPNSDSIHLHYTTTPGNFAQDRAAALAAVRPSQVRPSGDSNAPAKVGSDADYAALPSGTRFVGPDGQIRIKP